MPKIARQSIQELLRLMQPEEEGRMFRIDTQLVVRASCAIRFTGDLREHIDRNDDQVR